MDETKKDDIPNGNIGPKCNHSRCSDSDVTSKNNFECSLPLQEKLPNSKVDTNINCKTDTLNGYRFSKVCIFRYLYWNSIPLLYTLQPKLHIPNSNRIKLSHLNEHWRRQVKVSFSTRYIGIYGMFTSRIWVCRLSFTCHCSENWNSIQL